jgi:predicted dehydrogenase
VVFATLGYDLGSGKEVLAHVHASWLDPSKLRRTTVVGSRSMVVYDDLDSEAKLRVYDKGADPVRGGFGEFQFRLRSGDMRAPSVDLTEPLAIELDHFVTCVATGAVPRTDGWNGARVVAALEAAQRSLERGGTEVEVAKVGPATGPA